MNTIVNQIYHKYLKPEKFEGEMKMHQIYTTL